MTRKIVDHLRIVWAGHDVGRFDEASDRAINATLSA
ncbi:hypothetical protein ACVI1K_003557 [Bradyrhizobium sp. USDA 4508]